VVVFHCYRGWSDLTRIAQASFRTYFFPQKIFYHNIDYLADVVRQSGVTLIQMNDVESISQIGYRISTALKLRLIFEAHYHTSSLAAALDVAPERVRLLQKLENNVCRNADHLFVFTEEDRNRWLSLSQCPANRISVVPFGIEAPSQTPREGRQGIAFLGNMYYEPNRRAVLRMVHEVLPTVRSQLPNTPAYVVGDIPDDLRLLCLNSNIDVIGEVEAPGFILRRASVGIAPVTEGSGVRVKILSYIAAGLPVVATSIGSEGLSFPSVFEENTLMSTAARCVDILERPEFYRLLVLKTNFLVNKKHLWKHVVSGAVDIYDHIAKRKRREPEVAPIPCSEDPMWIQEVLKKGRFSAPLAPDIGPFRLGIAGRGELQTYA
jgi:hypothetical protein